MIVREMEARDRAEWDGLYAGYAAFYRVAQTEAMRDRVWAWLLDPGHEVEGLVAVAGDRLAGLAHHRPFARPLAAREGLYLDDLFVDPDLRGTGVADALLSRLTEIARARGCDVVRWITAEDNARARAVYDRVAVRTLFLTYDIKL